MINKIKVRFKKDVANIIPISSNYKLESAEEEIPETWITSEGTIIEITSTHKTVFQDFLRKNKTIKSLFESKLGDTASTSEIYYFATCELGWIRTAGIVASNFNVMIGKKSVAPKALASLKTYLNRYGLKPRGLVHFSIMHGTIEKSQKVKDIAEMMTYIKNNVKEGATKMKDKSLEASDSYTNNSKSVKAVFWSNRSTPSVVKPGQTVKAKKGYGTKSKVRSLTPAELEDCKKGKWLRGREDGKKHSDPGAKQSKYRPKLAKLQRDAKRRKLAASDTPNNRYKAFMAELFE